MAEFSMIMIYGRFYVNEKNKVQPRLMGSTRLRRLPVFVFDGGEVGLDGSLGDLEIGGGFKISSLWKKSDQPRLIRRARLNRLPVFVFS